MFCLFVFGHRYMVHSVHNTPVHNRGVSRERVSISRITVGSSMSMLECAMFNFVLYLWTKPFSNFHLFQTEDSLLHR